MKPGDHPQLFHEIAAIAKQRASPGTAVLVTGVGKAAAVATIARLADLDLRRIDLDSVVSKYIDETEKNLEELFDAAARQEAILFFDVADSLFGKHTNVKDGHVRHRSLDIDLLLQRIERFSGVVIMASNAKAPIDHPLRRRLQYIVDLPELAPSSDPETIHENLRATGTLYFAAMLEELGLFRVVDQIVTATLSGVLSIGPGSGRVMVQAFASGKQARLSENERRSLYSRAFGLSGGEGSIIPNGEFNELWLSFLSAVATFAGHETVRRTGHSLAENISLHGQGIGLDLVSELEQEIKDVMALLSYPDIRSAYGVRDMWEVIDRVAASELGGARNSQRYRTLAEAGRQVFDWLGKHAPLEGDLVPDAELIAACDKWLTAAAVTDDSPDAGPS